MSQRPVIDVPPAAKRRKTPASQRKPLILALQQAGLTQNEIAAKLGVSRASITRDLEDLRPARDKVNALLEEIQTHYERLQSPQKIAENYVELAERAKNEAIRLSAQDRILEHRGVVTAKESLRYKGGDLGSAVAPMFQLESGAQVNVTVHQHSQTQTTTIGRESESLHNAPTVTPANPTSIYREPAIVDVAIARTPAPTSPHTLDKRGQRCVRCGAARIDIQAGNQAECTPVPPPAGLRE